MFARIALATLSIAALACADIEFSRTVISPLRPTFAKPISSSSPENVAPSPTDPNAFFFICLVGVSPHVCTCCAGHLSHDCGMWPINFTDEERIVHPPTIHRLMVISRTSPPWSHLIMVARPQTSQCTLFLTVTHHPHYAATHCRRILISAPHFSTPFHSAPHFSTPFQHPS